MIQAIKPANRLLVGTTTGHPYFSTLIRGSSHLRVLHAYLVILFTLVLSEIVTGHQDVIIFFHTLASASIDYRARQHHSRKPADLCSPTTFAWCPIAGLRAAHGILVHLGREWVQGISYGGPRPDGRP